MKNSVFPHDYGDECLSCGRTPQDQNTALTYHRSDPIDPELCSGYLCPLCRQQIEAVLQNLQYTDCERCAAPLPEGGRNQLLEYDENDILEHTTTLCNNCLAERE